MKTRTKQRPTTSNKALQKRMVSYGLTSQQAVLSMRAVLRALSDELMAGKPVNLYKLGTFRFQLRRGRNYIRYPQAAFTPPRVQADSWCLKFKVSPLFRKQLKEKKVIPIYGRLPKPPTKPRI